MQRFPVGYFMIYHEKVLHNYFIPCHRKYSGQHNQCDIRADFILNGFLSPTISTTFLKLFQNAYLFKWFFAFPFSWSPFLLALKTSQCSENSRLSIRVFILNFVGCHTVKYTTAFLNSDWLYFLCQTHATFQRNVLQHCWIVLLDVVNELKKT